MAKVEDATTATPTEATTTPPTAKVEDKEEEECCCPKFDRSRFPDGNGKELQWKDKAFVKEHVWCFLYIPFTFGWAMTRGWKKIVKAKLDPSPQEFIVLADMKSPWYSNIYLSVKEEEVTEEGEENEKKKKVVVVPDCEMVYMTGSFLTKVFEGPYSQFGKWIKSMKEYVRSQGYLEDDVNNMDMYAYYATCPKCAKKYGENYTVLFVKVD